MRDLSGSQWCARHARSPALRRQRARPAPPRGVRPPVGPTSAFVPARGGGGRGDGGAPGIPLQASASHLRRGRGPGAPSSQSTCGGVCGLEGRCCGQALALPCPAPPFFPPSRGRISGSSEPRPGPGQGTQRRGDPQVPGVRELLLSSGFYYGEGLAPPVGLRGWKGRPRPGKRSLHTPAPTAGNWPGRTKPPAVQ